MKKVTWENAFLSLLWAALAAFGTLFIVFTSANKNTLKYTLGVSNGNPMIVKEINWCSDDYIPMDRSVTLSEAVRLIDSLNKTLK